MTVHAGRLRRRRHRDREHRAREHGHRADRRHHQGVRQPVAAVRPRPSLERRARGTRRRAPRRRPTSSASRSTARRARTLCAAAKRTCCRPSPAATRASRGCSAPQEIDPHADRRSPAPTPVTDLLGQPIADPFGQPGFPGFDGMSAAVSLAYVAAMQENGVPVTYAYISDAHDFHGVAGNPHAAFGPGDRRATSQQLKAYDDAFAAFFTRLAGDGINQGQHAVRVHGRRGRPLRRRARRPTATASPCRASTARTRSARSTPTSTPWSRTSSRRAAQFLGSARQRVHRPRRRRADRSTSRRKARRRPLAQTDPLTREFERASPQPDGGQPVHRADTDRLMVADGRPDRR